MPYTEKERRIKAEVLSRGLVRVRTKKVGKGKYAHVYVVKRAGKNGGHTVMGEPQEKKGK